MKTQKGITLIALIITIIVLLILAVVAISSITNDGIINYAKNARTEYEKAQINEQAILEGYMAMLDDKAWKDNGDGTFKNYKNGTIVKIGDYVNYIEGTYTHTPDINKGAGLNIQEKGYLNERYVLTTNQLTTENLTWRVLGVNEKGQLELISADPTQQTLYIANDVGYVYAEDNLNNFCNDLYGKGRNLEGKKVAIEARSLNAKDINNLTKYNPEKSYSLYGEKWTYKYPTTSEANNPPVENLTKNMWYKTEKQDRTIVTNWTNITSASEQKFRLPDGTVTINAENPDSIEIMDTYYYYNIANNLTQKSGLTSEKATEVANMLTKGTTNSYIEQWIATKCVDCISYASFCVFKIGNDYQTDGLLVPEREIYSSNIFFITAGNYRIRPVVTLSSDVELTGTGNDIGSSSNMWNIS